MTMIYEIQHLTARRRSPYPSARSLSPSALAPSGRCFSYSCDIGAPRPTRSRVTYDRQQVSWLAGYRLRPPSQRFFGLQWYLWPSAIRLQLRGQPRICTRICAHRIPLVSPCGHYQSQSWHPIVLRVNGLIDLTRPGASDGRILPTRWQETLLQIDSAAMDEATRRAARESHRPAGPFIALGLFARNRIGCRKPPGFDKSLARGWQGRACVAWLIRMRPDVPEQNADMAGRNRRAGVRAGRSPGRLHGASSRVPDVVADDAITATMRGLLQHPSRRVSSSGPRESASRQRCEHRELSPH